MKKSKTVPWAVIMKRELCAYFSSPVAYIAGALFLLFSGLLFFTAFFLVNRAELRNFFELLPLLFSFFIPALTMRIFSEEKRSGTMETLVTLPVRTADIAAGKYLAALLCSLALFAPTLLYVVPCLLFASSGVDAGPVAGGYMGAVLLASSFTAIGVFASAVTKNQIVSFFLAFAICIFLTMVSSFAVFLPGFLVKAVSFVSASSHFLSVSRGIIDSRDILYFLSVTAVFVALTVRAVSNSRKGY